MTFPAAAMVSAAVLVVSGCGRVGFEQRRLDAQVAWDAAASLDASRLDASASLDADVVDAAADAPAVARDLCATIPRLTAEPVLDGMLEPGLVPVRVEPEGWSPTTIPMPAEVVARAAFAWHPDGLYAFIDVDDPDRHAASAPAEVWCGDSVELYVDDDGAFAAPTAYDRPGTVQLIAAAPSSDTTPGTYGQRYATGPLGEWLADGFVMVPRAGGYMLESLIRARELDLAAWSLAAGGRVGVSIGINVSTPDGSGGTDPMCTLRLGQYFLRVIPADALGAGEPYRDTRAFCTPTLE